MEKHFELIENDFKRNFLGIKVFIIKATKKTKYENVGVLGLLCRFFLRIYTKKMKTKNLENFQKLVSNEKSGWLDKFLHYKANQKRLDNSSKVAVNVLEALREKKMSQKDLAEKMNVSAQQINKNSKSKI